MAVEKVGIYRKWLDPVPKDENGNPVPRVQWPRKRRYHWIVRWYGTTGKRYGEVFETRKEAERRATELQRQSSSGRSDKPRRIALTAKKETSDIIEWQPKDRENRVVPLSDETEQLLANLQEDTPVRHPYVFISPRRLQRIKERRRTGKWNSRRQIINNMGREFEAILSKAGVEDLTSASGVLNSLLAGATDD
jgi:integrase